MSGFDGGLLTVSEGSCLLVCEGFLSQQMVSTCFIIRIHL